MTERGTVLGGRYELDQIIGRGGMAEVWRARDRRLVRDVAVKRLRVDLASDPTFQARFRREAQSAAGLNHPNIVAVYDTGEELDDKSDVSVPYIVMELIEGVTLRDVLRDGRKILPERALEFSRGVLDALAYSHRAGIIHRDIKPANVMLTPDGSVKVMDFGIARAVADTSATMTQTAAVIGTAQYLSPEQARGEKVDNRSDIYSVGCLLYELLVSQPPFRGDSPVSVAYQHVREIPVAPSTLDPEITADMDAIVLKALAKDPADRYQDAREFADDVNRAIRGERVHAVPPVPGAEAPTSVMSSQTQTRTAVAAHAPVAPASAPSPLVETDEEVVEEEEPKSRKGLIALIALAVLLVVGLGIGLFVLLNPAEPAVETVTVPTVISWGEEGAQVEIRNAGLEPDVVYVPGTEDNRGEVVTQTPAAGETVEVGSTVLLEVSQGPEAGTIPEDIVGMTEQEAIDTLERAGFTDISSTPADPRTEAIDAEAGAVTATNPPAGAADVALDTPITLTIATGRSVVPRLTGLTEAAARDAAKEAGFDNVEVVEEEVEDATPGEVFGQAPEPGEELNRNESIRITVAKAPEVVLVGVPNLFGLNADQAADTVAELGLTISEVLEEETTEQEPGLVFRQTPASGEQVEEGTAISITVALEPAAVEVNVPDLSGMTEGQARAAARNAGFEDLRVEEEPSDEIQPGRVLRQSPEAETPADPAATPIIITLATEPEE